MRASVSKAYTRIHVRSRCAVRKRKKLIDQARCVEEDRMRSFRVTPWEQSAGKRSPDESSRTDDRFGRPDATDTQTDRWKHKVKKLQESCKAAL